MTLTRRAGWSIALVGAVAVLGVGAAVFEPWRLFTSTTVHEALPGVAVAPRPGTAAGSTVAAPSPAAPAGSAGTGPVTVASGQFISHEHRTSGQARVLRLADGSRILRLEHLDTSDGPALHVWLSDQPVIAGHSGWGRFDDGAHLDLGDLKGNKGDQNYPVPDGVDLHRFTSVSIWCARFHVSFGAAALSLD